MVLLTSSTVSIILSSSIICLFTFLLFLSGYLLQQQSVRNIQDAIRPPPPPPPVYPINNEATSNDILADDAAASSKNHQQTLSSSSTEHNPDKNAAPGTYAYLQLLSTPDPAAICSSILFFHQLTGNENHTAIQDRLFMYPREWDAVYTSPDHPNPNPNPSSQSLRESTISKSLQHLRTSALTHNIWLLPIDTSTITTSSGSGLSDTKLLRLGQIQFVPYDAVLYLQSPGMVVDVSRLDSLLLDRPVPGKHDPERVESYNNAAWMAMPLRPEREDRLPGGGVYLVTVNNAGGRLGQVEARGHVVTPGFEGGRGVVRGVRGVEGEEDDDEGAGYVVFEQEGDGKVKWEGNELYGAWRKGMEEVCPGVDLEGFYE
ncbi:uncharacterized protein BP01DRAFT_403307 [Aspergillus saccharolyticus JOP 1030-1]|uniref:Uncharacterized protein n=1 Tax=Aspergillus saccharolyticus JOP 1030-1 TaxID=1450539 RepID=A0A318ZP41_9EURO|nr:hypothetical protein BP01DRAFT_403307 [Aspergillus saccharolyticus JOP 1030-1]PYH48747.1 hypothetical protein BP01DRAFT_403307 [Aspergillus saccharolyticus JOP 1030-1]